VNLAGDHSALLAEALAAIRALKGQVAELERARSEPIAIVGMGCRLPGGIDSVEDFWDALTSGRELLSDVPPDRWDNDSYYDAVVGTPGKICTKRGGFVRSKDAFDASFFRVSPREAGYVDPQHRLLLEIAWEALEHANIAPDSLYLGDTGVFVGISSFDYAGLVFGEVAETALDHWVGTGSAHSAAAGRISYALGVQGPSIAVDTACSSSLVAVHLACESLRRRECGLALVGGVNMVLSPLSNLVFSRAHMLSPVGRCKTFDQSADGYARSEGAGMVVLKRLSEAEAAGNRILAVIRGAAVNQDGPSSGLTVPNGPAQRRLILQALANAGVSAADIGYVEAHGTGTPLGDPIEMNALSEVFKASHRLDDHPLFVGSAKTNLGHMEAAAGVGGLIKLVLQLQHGEIAPHLNFTEPSRQIPWAELPIRVPTEKISWPQYGARRLGGVSSFGFSGTNAHVIVEEAPSVVARAARTRTRHLLCLSAKTELALNRLQEAYATLLSDPAAPRLADIARSANGGRAHFDHRVAVVAASAREAAEQLTQSRAPAAPAAARPRRRRDRLELGFLFTGQGSQLEGAGRVLFRESPAFRDELLRCDAIVARAGGFSVVDALYSGALQKSELTRTAHAQPLTVSLQLALVALWHSWGIRPSFVMGHSLGEYTAACVAGIFDAEAALELVAARGRLMQRLPETGCMVALECPLEQVEAVFETSWTELAIAAVNAPTQTVVSGAKEQVEALLARLPAVRSRRLDVSHAFHSPLMRPMLSDFAGALAEVNFSEPTLGFISNLSGAMATQEPTNSEYWLRHVLEPVQFRRGIEAMQRAGCNAFIEIGAQPTLLALAARSLPNADASFYPSLDGRQDDWQRLLETTGALYTEGLAIDWQGLDGEYGDASVRLPSYPFERKKYWYGLGGGRRRASVGLVHPLLGEARQVDDPLRDALVFEAELSAVSPAYLADHRVLDGVLFPAAGYVELMLAAAGGVMERRGAVLRDLRVLTPLALEEDSTRTVRTTLKPSDAGGYSLEISSRESGEDATNDWQLHAQAALEEGAGGAPEPLKGAATLAELSARLGPPLDLDSTYRSADQRGLSYGPAFRCLRHIQEGKREVFARFALDAIGGDAAEPYAIYPQLLDAAYQMIGPLLPGAETYVPVATEAIHYLKPIGRQGCGHLELRSAPSDSSELSADLDIFDERGDFALAVRGLRLRRWSTATLRAAKSRELSRLLYRVGWRDSALKSEVPERSASEPGRGALRLLFADAGGVSAELARVLAENGAHTVVVTPAKCAELTRMERRRFTLDPGRPEHYAALLAELEREGAWPAQDGAIVYLAALSVAALNEAESPALAETKLLGCAPLLQLVKALTARAQGVSLFVVTRGAVCVRGMQSHVNAEQAALVGFVNTLRAESPGFKCRHIDLDPTSSRHTPAGEALRLAAELDASQAEDSVAFRHSQRFVARLERLPARTLQASEPVDVRLQDYGSADQLLLESATRRAPGANEVEVSVRAGGLNFKDVLHVWGVLRTICEERGLPFVDRRKIGFECSGVVARVGAGVSNVRVGDEVIALGFECLNSFVTVDAGSVVRKPKRISHAEAAGLPTAYITAVYGLLQLAKLKRGEKVLVHAAAGGVGQAAIQLCTELGAEVFATASPGKWDFLRAQGVTQIMNSRTLEFERELLQRTAQRGVDVVLNSLSGEFIPASLRCLARGGRFVEIGKRGIWSPEEVARERPDARYHAFDLGDLELDTARSFPALLADVCARIDANRLHALPVQTFPVEDVSEALRTLAESKNVGKVVVEFPEPKSEWAAAERTSTEPIVHANGSYLVSGGLGALGLEVAEWLAEQGARELVLVSRRPPTKDAEARLQALRTRGARVEVCLADVAGPRSELEGLLTILRRSLAPLRGIVHAAGVTDDALLPDMSEERFTRVFAPKVVGAWNLHCLTRDLPLDFFVTFSSAIAWLGSPGQANYAAANAFLDALMEQRKLGGLPGLSIGWGPWAQTGMAARLAEPLRESIKSRGLSFVSPRKNLALLELLLTGGSAYALAGAVNWPMYFSRLYRGVNPSFLRAFSDESSSASALESGTLKTKLAAAPENERRSLLLNHLHSVLVKVLRFPPGESIDIRRGLFDLGVDSLSAVEIKSRIELALAVTIPATLMMDFPTLDALTNHLHDDVLGYASKGIVASADISA
jgi:acyl transferase domain-containing protein/acyl carrier protein